MIVFFIILAVMVVLWIASEYNDKPFDKNDSNTGWF